MIPRGAGLSFEQAPPLGAPLRFFLTAPLFGVLAALLLAWQGPPLLASRFAPGTLGLAHLLTLGFLAMVMTGALMQMLPVVAGSPMPRPLATAALVHAGLCAGALALAVGLALGMAGALGVGLTLLLAALGGFALAALRALARAPARNATVTGMRLALVALLVLLCLGAYLAVMRARGANIAPAWGHVHAAWALTGWVGLLVMSAAYQVVPMFQITPPYPRALSRWLASLVFVALCLDAFGSLAGHAWLATAAGLAAAAGFAAFALATLYLQARRRRRVGDATLLFWRLGMAALLGACALWLALQVGLPAAWEPGAELLLGVLWLHGFAAAVVSGMLYKIVPFLGWFHLQALAGGFYTIPNMKQFIGERAARVQLALHGAALALLACACLWPEAFTRPAALCAGVGYAALGVNLWRAAHLYRRVRVRLLAAGAVGQAARPRHTSGAL